MILKWLRDAKANKPVAEAEKRQKEAYVRLQAALRQRERINAAVENAFIQGAAPHVDTE